MTATLARRLLPALTLISIACFAFADGVDRHGGDGEKLREKFAAADTDHDGSLSRAEAAAGMPRLAKHFDEIDTDHDGKLTLAEVAAFLKQAHAERQTSN